ncbi:MAG TPA: aldose 1-epimerase family protein [Spirochaetota bacterium]|nr:aldose 1-epimerase family protein [Spirochaetota bacterium]
MVYNISNDFFTAGIAEKGAELKSLKNRQTAQEYIWQPRNGYWPGSAPVLFPVVGMLKDNKYKFKDREYYMPKHGFAKDSIFVPESIKKDTLTLSLTATAATKKLYPFNFKLVITFSLNNSGLTVTATVKNPDNSALYFSIGAHPALNIDLDNTSMQNYFIEFEKPETSKRYAAQNGLMKTKPEPFLRKTRYIFINENIFNRDALVFKNLRSKFVTVKNKQLDYAVTVDTGHAPWLGIWSQPGAPFLCIEPWFGYPDKTDSTYNFKRKTGIIKLKPQSWFATYYAILIK